MESGRRGRPILYYAMGGGLGHLTRTLAIADELAGRATDLRILVSSDLAPMVFASSPHAIDHVSGETLASKANYYAFLSNYIEWHRFSLIILDTFPFGIVGEWLALATDIPAVLIARSLRWDRYADVIQMKKSGVGRRFPSRSLIIEPLDMDYEAALRDQSETATLDEPVISVRCRSTTPSGEWEPVNRCAVVHSGNEGERNALLAHAQKLFRDKNIAVPIDTVFPDRQIYPADELLSRYRYVVSGAGYNMAAMASQAGPFRHHYLYPFRRKFDDQHARKKHVESGLWKDAKPCGAPKAARWIEDFMQKAAPGCRYH